MKTLIPAAIRCLLMFTAITGSLVCLQPAQAYTVVLQQVGANVVATGSGAIDLTGLNFGGTLTNGQALIEAYEAQIFTGPTSLTSFDLYTGLSGPTDFGSGFTKFADSGSGDFVGIGAFELLIVPQGYISGTPLSDSMTFNNATFSSLGVTPGTYVWTWGTGQENQNFTLIAAGPTPSPTPTATATPTATPTPTPCTGRCTPTPRPRPTPHPRPN